MPPPRAGTDDHTGQARELLDAVRDTWRLTDRLVDQLTPNIAAVLNSTAWTPDTLRRHLVDTPPPTAMRSPLGMLRARLDSLPTPPTAGPSRAQIRTEQDQRRANQATRSAAAADMDQQAARAAEARASMERQRHRDNTTARAGRARHRHRYVPYDDQAGNAGRDAAARYLAALNDQEHQVAATSETPAHV